MTGLTPSPEQTSILDLGLTTIRVRAGAGTGKTTTVAMVIAELISRLGLDPEHVVGVTFTNKAAAELADRVRSMVGSGEPGRQVEVHTYHGFATQVLSEFGALAGVDNRAKVITPTFARQLLSETFHHRSYRWLDITQTRTLDRIRKLGDRLGDHLLTPADLMTVTVEGEVGDTRREMAETLAEYDDDKRRLRVVDYSDLVTLSTQLVTRHPELAETIRGRYKVVVLDEYQDTNPAQRRLLTAIFGDGFPVIAVGDEDQTIYEWRGASPENFEMFPIHFTAPTGGPATDRTLTLNRRSTQQILDIANRVRRVANPAAEPLHASDPDLEGEVVTFWARDAIEEAEWIARVFERLHTQDVAWRDMAVLFRKNKDFAVVVDALGRHDIPVEVANIGGLLSVPEVADLRAWLTVIERPEDSAALTQILLGSRYRLGLADLAPLARRAARGLAEPDDSDDPQPITLIEAIDNADEVEALRHEARTALRHFQGIYRELLLESQGLSLVEVCRMVLDRTRAWQDVESLPANKRLTARLNLYRLLDLAEDWSPLRGRPSLQAFLDYLGAMEDEPAEELDAARLSGEDAVTLVTVHRAKGLEWENVAIPALVKDNFPSKAQQFPDPLRFPEFVPPELRIDHVLGALPDGDRERADFFREQQQRQEWRVAYVAVTRAKRRLYASGAHWYGLPEPSKNPREPSPLWELIDESPSTRDAGRAELTARPEVLVNPRIQPSPDPIFTEGWEEALRRVDGDREYLDRLAIELGVEERYRRRLAELEGRLFSLAEAAPVAETEPARVVSVTGLVTYAQCPKRFYWSDVDPLPRRPSPAASRGTEVHRRIELHQRGQVPLDLVEEDLYDVVTGEEEGPAEGPYQTYLASRFAQRHADLVEAPFAIALESGYRVRGRIDAVYIDGGHWEVVDFKSGRRSAEPARLVQLQAYGVAVDSVDFGVPSPDELDVTFAYLGGGGEVDTHHADRAWISTARETLEAVTLQIEDEAFEATPGEWCGHCDFLRFCRPGREWIES